MKRRQIGPADDVFRDTGIGMARGRPIIAQPGSGERIFLAFFLPHGILIAICVREDDPAGTSTEVRVRCGMGDAGVLWRRDPSRERFAQGKSRFAPGKIQVRASVKRYATDNKVCATELNKVHNGYQEERNVGQDVGQCPLGACRTC